MTFDEEAIRAALRLDLAPEDADDDAFFAVETYDLAVEKMGDAAPSTGFFVNYASASSTHEKL